MLVVRIVAVFAITLATIAATALDLIVMVQSIMCVSANLTSKNTCSSNGNQLNSI